MLNLSKNIAATSIVFALISTAAFAQPADTVYTNGKIYTVIDNQPWAEAVAIQDGKFLAVGSVDEIVAVIGDNTVVVDLDGRFVMPGIVDMHLHLPNVHTGEESGELKFSPSLSPEEIQEVLSKYLKDHPDLEWIRGEQWGTSAFPNGRMTKELIDEVSADRPIFLIDDTGHNGTANSKAMELAGITSETEVPPGGAIHIGADGAPSGYLSEGAMGLIGTFLPRPDSDAYYRAISRATEPLTPYGITAWREANANEQILQAYRRLEDEGNFPFRITAAILIDDYQKYVLTYEEAQDLIERREEYNSKLITVNTIKWFADGTPLSRTSRLLEPYPETDSDFGGDALFEREKQDIVRFHKAGIQGMFHALGDGTIRTILDLIETARLESLQPDIIHHLAHANLIHPDDIRRFSKLGVAAEFSPRALMHPGSLSDLAFEAIGPERAARWSPVRDLLDAGALVAYGSDWPQGTPNADPWAALEVFVTRQDPTGENPGQLGESTSIEEAIKIFTLNGAKLMLLEDEIGSIAVGKRADFVVLDQNLLEVNPSKLSDTMVLRTVFGGETVFSR